MLVTWLLEALGYALLGACVVAVNWRRPRTRIAGATLLALTLASSASFFALRGADLFYLRVMREVMLIAGVSTVFAYMYFVGDACKPYRCAIAICLIDVTFCSGILLYGSNADVVRSAFGWGVDIIFIGLCICIASPGLVDAYLDWIADIERVRRMDSSAPDLDWAIRNLDRVSDR